MIYNFNKEKLDKLLYDFYRLTGLAASVWDSQVNLLSFQPKNMCRFCTMVKSSPLGRKRCNESDKAVCMECAKTGKPTTHYCHAGLVDTAVPIKFKDTVLGYIIFGQVTDDSDIKLNELCKELKLDYNEMSNAYGELEKYDKERISSAASIMKNVTAHLWLSEYIEIGFNAVAQEIDDYIRANLKEKLTVEKLCERFFISKNRLYDISRQWFKMTVGEYITSLRVEEAKRLLASTDLSVKEVSSAVGISDYNYFTKVFKNSVGIPPLKYKKGYPFHSV